MRRDLIIAILASFLFHSSLFYGDKVADYLFPPKAKARVAVVDDTPKIEIMEMPPLEPEKPEVAEESADTAAAPVDFAPPMQSDVPSIVMADSFVQQMQPPPPENVKPNSNLVTIPATRPTTAGTRLTNVFNLADLDQIPVVSYQAKPVYPFEMSRAGITGEVVVEFVVDTQGEVREAYAKKSTQREFEASAIQAVSKWRFRAGKRGGKAVNTRMSVPIVFNLSEE
jgi:protein TonB